ncbi:MAG: tRNA uridine-5-carboxymethylaminomethyl(34) synthesis GTPase MnmE [Spirochaetota bacterium]|nr:tRNA uridine-5-carboxymethylaminomethyl(34) synthesis GTPase MnmE [Spirochaetota bacterium]
MLDDTICAPATPPITSPLGIIRISGPCAYWVVNSIFDRPNIIKPRYAVYGSIIESNEILDDVVLVFYQSPHSFTGEDMVDIFCHGNPIIIRKIIRLLNQLGARTAEPGEFSKRAFLNGKIDLTEAEAINHVITATSEWEVSTAIKQMHGTLKHCIRDIKDKIIHLKGDIESNIDFTEEDLEFITQGKALFHMREIEVLISDLLRRCRIGDRISHGIDMPIVGKPNVGKSSILNLMLNSERAIVSHIPGTTRDLINEIVQFAGIRINLIDTAGIGTTNCELEKKGIELSVKKIGSASIVIAVFDASTGITDNDSEIIKCIEKKKKIILANKIDIASDKDVYRIESVLGNRIIPFSAKMGIGLSELENGISDIIRDEVLEYENSFLADVRILNQLEISQGIIENCQILLSHNEPHEIIAYELQNLMDNLSEITGEISPDDVLNSIFSRFCIGK